MDVKTIFEEMPRRFKPGALAKPTSYYFSIESHKYTVKLGDECVVEPGKTLDNADVVLKTTEKLFLRMVVEGKAPGPLDIARGKIKTNDPGGLQALRQAFDFSG